MSHEIVSVVLWLLVSLLEREGAHEFVDVNSMQNLPVDANLVRAEPEGSWRRGHCRAIEGWDCGHW